MTRRSLLAALAAASATTAATAPLRQSWRDPVRGRDIPVLLRPAEAAGARPLVLLSHGLGGSREGLGYLGRAFAAAGFHALHLQHPGSDEALWRGAGGVSALGAAALDPANAVARLLDAVFALEEVLRRAAERTDPLSGRVDPTRLAIAGHSFGAWTVQHLLGQRIPGGDRGLPVPERRLVAGIALSPSPPRGMPPQVAFARIAAPILHVTGTLDSGFVEGATPADREIPFHATRSAPAALAVLDGANHAAFADEAAAGPRWSDPTHHARTAALSVLFLRTVLEGDAESRATLLAGAPDLMRAADRLETKGF